MFKGLIAGIVGIYLSIVGVFHPAPPVPVQPAIVTETSVATGTPQAVTAPKDNSAGKTLSVTDRLRQQVADLKKQVGAVTQSTQNTQTVTPVVPAQETPKKPADTTSTSANPPAPIVVNVTVQQTPVSAQTVTTATVAPAPTPALPPLEASISISDANTIKVLTNRTLQADQTTFTNGVTLTSATLLPNGAQTTWKNTKEPAYLYQLSTSAIEMGVAFNITITTGTESLTRELRENYIAP